MRAVAFFISGLLFLCGGYAPALAEIPDKETLGKLVRQLNSTQRSMREKAREELIQIGPGVIDTLMNWPALGTESDQKQLRQVILELQAIDRKNRLQVRPLNLPLRPLSLSQAVEILSEQTGHRVHLADPLPTGNSKITFSQGDLTFMSALVEVLQGFQLDLELADSQRELLIVERTVPRAFFLIDKRSEYGPSGELCRVNRVLRKEIAGNEQQDLLRIELQMFFSPEQAPLFLKVPGKQMLIDEIDEPTSKEGPRFQRTKLEPFAPESVTEVPCHFGLRSPVFRVDWRVPKDLQPRDCLLSLSLNLHKASGLELFEFSDWESTTQSQRKGLVVVTRDEVEIQEDRVGVLLLVMHSDRGAPFESHRDWLPWTELTLSDKEGKYRPVGHVEKILEADGTTALRYQFARPASPQEEWKLNYRLPSAFENPRWWFQNTINLRPWLEQN